MSTVVKVILGLIAIILAIVIAYMEYYDDTKDDNNGEEEDDYNVFAPIDENLDDMDHEED
jgi:glucose uptake protein GlcU